MILQKIKNLFSKNNKNQSDFIESFDSIFPVIEDYKKNKDFNNAFTTVEKSILKYKLDINNYEEGLKKLYALEISNIEEVSVKAKQKITTLNYVLGTLNSKLLLLEQQKNEIETYIQQQKIQEQQEKEKELNETSIQLNVQPEITSIQEEYQKEEIGKIQEYQEEQQEKEKELNETSIQLNVQPEITSIQEEHQKEQKQEEQKETYNQRSEITQINNQNQEEKLSFFGKIKNFLFSKKEKEQPGFIKGFDGALSFILAFKKNNDFKNAIMAIKELILKHKSAIHYYEEKSKKLHILEISNIEEVSVKAKKKIKILSNYLSLLYKRLSLLEKELFKIEICDQKYEERQKSDLEKGILKKQINEIEDLISKKDYIKALSLSRKLAFDHKANKEALKILTKTQKL
ncbi:hypothetical protein KAZ01_02825, partial [Candidatus Gracilibacteria bacterium]|nr:hypothetical protein [Candidatus Gracilibacteria bacterium]